MEQSGRLHTTLLLVPASAPATYDLFPPTAVADASTDLGIAGKSALLPKAKCDKEVMPLGLDGFVVECLEQTHGMVWPGERRHLGLEGLGVGAIAWIGEYVACRVSNRVGGA